MANKNRQLNNEQGSTALLMAVMVLFSTLAIILAVSDVIRNRIDTNRTQINSTKAYFAAEAGAERALWEIRNNSCETKSDDNCFVFTDGSQCEKSACTDSSASHSLTNSSNFKVRDEIDGGYTKLTCIGSYQGVSRAVELRF